MKGLTLGLFLGFCAASSAAKQLPASIRVPIVGYVLDNEIHAIRPVVGILGSARIDAPMELGLSVAHAAFLPDQKHAIIVSEDRGEAVVLDLEQPSDSIRVARVGAAISMIRASQDGASAGLYDAVGNRLLIVRGLPRSPAIESTIDLSFARSPLRQLALSNDGNVALLAFAVNDSHVLHTWTSSTGTHFVGQVSRISAIAFMGEDAVVADSGSNQVILIRAVRNRAIPVSIADISNGISAPSALFVSTRNEIYVGNGDRVLVMDARGHMLRNVVCACVITMMEPLGKSAIRLTGDLERSLFVLDEATVPERILFVPALSVLPTADR